MAKHKTTAHAKLQKLFAAAYPQRPDLHELTPSAENGTRMYRALSWLKLAEQCGGGADERFLFLWIAFNAAYGDDARMRAHFRAPAPGAQNPQSDASDMKKLRAFLGKVIARDKNELLAKTIDAHREEFHALFESENRFLFFPFWAAAYSPAKWRDWKNPLNQFNRQQRDVQNALQTTRASAGKTGLVLKRSFERLYTLRNQIFHGGATYRSSYNRGSLQLGNAILGACVPAILQIMLEAIAENRGMKEWGRIAYPAFLPIAGGGSDQNPPKRFHE